VVLDDANFHECVNLDDFDATRTLALIPPDGEFVLMNYRITGAEFRPPFRVFPTLEETSPFKVELVLRVRADIPEANYGTNVVIRFPVPKNAATVIPELGPGGSSTGVASGPTGSTFSAAGKLPTASSAAAAFAASGQSADYSAKDREVVWTIKKFGGGQEHTLRTKITLASASTSGPAAIRKELGPVSVAFEVPMYNASSLQVRYLRIAETHKGYKPHRWVRYVTTSNSYVCRL
jgi:AP-4 complex subunit mu-1